MVPDVYRYFTLFIFLDNIVNEQCSPVGLMKMHVHIANISKNISNILHDMSDISLLSNNLRLEMIKKIQINTQFEYVKT